MKRSRPWWLATTVLGLLASGCLSTTPAVVKSTLAGSYQFDGGYHFWDYTVTDGSGNFLRNVSRAELSDAAVAFETVLPLGGSEPSLGVTSNGTVLVAAYDHVQRSTDHGRTWTLSSELTSPAPLSSQDRWLSESTSLFVDPDTNDVFVTRIYDGAELTCLDLSRSRDDAVSWDAHHLAFCPVGGMEHQKVLTGRPSASPTVPVPDSLRHYPNNLYVCYSRGLGGPNCATSFDAGDKFAYERNIHDADIPCAATFAGHPVATPDGVLTVPISFWSTSVWTPTVGPCHRGPSVAISKDNGFTWRTRSFPNSSIQNLEFDPDVTYTKDGTGYLVYRDQSQSTQLLRSRDHFETWEGPFRVSPKDLTFSFFSAITSGDDGRIAIAYLGTRQAQDPHVGPEDADGNSHWHLFVTTSVDAEKENLTFVTQQVTPAEDPVQVGCVNSPDGRGRQGSSGCNNLYNFISIVADPEGRFFVAFADGCDPRNGCTGDTDSGYWAKDHEAALAIQDRGEGLRAGKILQSLGLHHTPTKPHMDGQT